MRGDSSASTTPAKPSPAGGSLCHVDFRKRWLNGMPKSFWMCFTITNWELIDLRSKLKSLIDELVSFYATFKGRVLFSPERFTQYKQFAQQRAYEVEDYLSAPKRL